MRKLFALLFVAAAFTFVACEKKTETTAGGDSTAKDTAVQEVPTTVDTVKVDTAKVDTVKK